MDGRIFVITHISEDTTTALGLSLIKHSSRWFSEEVGEFYAFPSFQNRFSSNGLEQKGGVVRRLRILTRQHLPWDNFREDGEKAVNGVFLSNLL